MDSKKWLSYFNASPQAVQDYFTSDLSVKNEQAAKKQLAYDDDAWERVMDVAWNVFFEQLPFADFREKIRRLAGDRKPDDVERVVLLAIILPLADLVYWDVEARLVELGMAIGDIQSVLRVTLRPVSYGAAVRRIASIAKISLLQEEMVRRMREAFVSYMKGVRTIEQLKELFLRGQSEGGLGLSQAQTEQYLAAMDDFLATTSVVSEQEYAEWLTQMERQAQASKSAPTVAESATDQDGDEAERLSVAARTSRVADGPLEQTVESTLAAVQLPTLEEYLNKRLRNVISTRLREVRNPAQVKQLLAREIKVGGMEFQPDEVERVAGIIEQAYAASRESIGNEEKRQIQETVTQQKTKIEERKKRESEEHAKWYQEKIQATSGDGTSIWSVGAAPEMVPSSVGKTRGVTASVSSESAAMASSKRPSVDDVRGPVRLVGLEEELSGLTMANFRRLSSDPEQAAQKIKQKLEAMRSDSFERWVAGIEAWRRSPLQQQYLTLVAESFAKGEPVGELVERRRKTDPTMPTGAEVGAIVQLNSVLQY